MILIISFLLICVLFFLLYATAPNVFYMYIFEHEDWKLWKYLEENIDKFEFDESFSDPKYPSIITKEFIFGEYRAIVWCFDNQNPKCSIHLENQECVLGTWWERKSKRFAKKLLKKLDD